MESRWTKNHVPVDMKHKLIRGYVVMPAALGACVMLAIALIVNNIPNTRKYPEFWL